MLLTGITLTLIIIIIHSHCIRICLLETKTNKQQLLWIMLQLQLGIELVFSLVVSLKCCGVCCFFSRFVHVVTSNEIAK